MSTHEKYVLSDADYQREYKIQLRTLIEAADGYDQGDFSKTKLLALSISKLIGDRFERDGKPKENFVSLTTRLGMKPKEMADISFHLDLVGQTELHGPFIAHGILPVGGNGHVALLDGFEDYPEWYKNARTNFQEWWDWPVLRDGQGSMFSRRTIVENMRDKEVAHTDSALPIAYGRLAYGDSLNIKGTEIEVKSSDSNITNIIVRQTAHELIRTLDPDYPSRFSIPSGGLAHPIVLAIISYTNQWGHRVALHRYDGYRFMSLWASSKEIAKKWMESNPGKGGYNTPIIKFYGERVSSMQRPDGLRFKFLNYYPFESHIAQMQHGLNEDGVISFLSVVEKR